MQTYQKSDVAWFCSKDDSRWEFSNMAGGMPVYWPLQRRAESRWHSTEQLYQASKYDTGVTCVPVSNSDVHPNVRKRIRESTNARGAKMTQKCAVKAGLVRHDWEGPDEVRLKAMEWVLELKVYWNRDTFGQAIRDTGDRVIVEISKNDTFWGCKEQADGTLVGENQLGTLLMRVRSRIPEIARGEFTHPQGFLLP